jgi:hypothetical protein
MDEVQTLLLAEEVVIQERSRLAPTHHTHINTVINTVSASSRTLCDGAARPPDASFAHCLNRRVKTLLDSPENPGSGRRVRGTERCSANGHSRIGGSCGLVRKEGRLGGAITSQASVSIHLLSSRSLTGEAPPRSAGPR